MPGPEQQHDEGAPENLRRGFREALERKKQQHHAGSAGPDERKDATIPHGNDKHKRQFRRKSG